MRQDQYTTDQQPLVGNERITALSSTGVSVNITPMQLADFVRDFLTSILIPTPSVMDFSDHTTAVFSDNTTITFTS